MPEGGISGRRMRGKSPGIRMPFIPGAAPCFYRRAPDGVMLFICGIPGGKKRRNQKNAVQRIAVRRQAVEKGPNGPFFASAFASRCTLELCATGTQFQGQFTEIVFPTYTPQEKRLGCIPRLRADSWGGLFPQPETIPMFRSSGAAMSNASREDARKGWAPAAAPLRDPPPPGGRAGYPPGSLPP